MGVKDEDVKVVSLVVGGVVVRATGEAVVRLAVVGGAVVCGDVVGDMVVELSFVSVTTISK